MEDFQNIPDVRILRDLARVDATSPDVGSDLTTIYSKSMSHGITSNGKLSEATPTVGCWISQSLSYV